MILNTPNASTLLKMLLVIVLLNSLSPDVRAEGSLICGDLEVSDSIEGLEELDTSGIANIIYNESGLWIWKPISDTAFPGVSCYAMLDKNNRKISVLLNGTNESQILRSMLPSGDYKRPCDLEKGECKNFSENGTYIYSILREAAKSLRSGSSASSAARLGGQPHYRCAFADSIRLFKYEISAFRDDPLIGISSHNWPLIRRSDSSQPKIPYGSLNVTFQFAPTAAKSYCILGTIYQCSGDSSRIYLGDRLWMSRTNWSGDTGFLYAPSPFPANLTLSVDLRNSSAYAQVWLAMVSDGLDIKGRMSGRIDGDGTEEQIDRVAEPDFLRVLELEKVVPCWPPLMIFDLKPEDNSELTSNEVTVQFRTTQESNSSVLIREEAQNIEIPPKTSSGTEHALNFDLKRNTSYLYNVESRSAYDQTTSEERRFLVSNGVIFLGKPYEFTINRDYDQRCTLKIKNIDSKIHNVTINVTNPYDDLILGFKETGTANETIRLSPGDERELELIVHAQDAMKERYMIYVKLSDLNETGLVDEAAVKIAVPFVPEFTIRETESDPLGLTKTIRIENLGKALTDLKVRADPEGEIYLYPRINHFRLNASESLDFYAIPLFSENTGRISGKITASAGRINKSIPVIFECKGDSRLIKVDLSHLQIIVEIDDWYCTNRPIITRSFLLPPGFNESDVISANMSMDFGLQSDYEYLNHSVLVYLNGQDVGKLSDTVPNGRYFFNLSADDFEYNSPERGTLGNNELRLETIHLNQAHYLVSEKIIIRLCLKNLQRWVCAPSPEVAEQILWKTPGIEPSYSNLTVNISSPQKGQNLTVGQNITISASVYGRNGDSSGPQKHSEVKAVFEHGYNPLILFDDGKHNDGASNDGIYANTWSPSMSGSEDITVNATSCRQTRGSNNTWVLVEFPNVEKPNLLISALEMSKSAGTPGKVNISVEISNVGAENAGKFEANLSNGNQTIAPKVIESLDRNSSRRVSWGLDESELCGNIIRACADARREVEETDEYDNCIQDSYCPSCIPPPPLEGYPVSVDIETTTPDNLRFWDKIGRELYYWVEKGSNIGKKYRVWIRVPRINQTGDSEIRLKYLEGSEPSNFQDPSKVFTFFDDFQSIDDSKWSISKSGEGTLTVEAEGVRIHADARASFQAYLQSVKRFHPGIAVMFRANISEGQSKDVKTAGFIEDHNATSGSSVVWLAEGKDLFSRSKRGWMPVLQNYPAGYRRWEIGWLDSNLFFKMDTMELAPLDSQRSDYPSQGLPIEFNLNTDIAPKDADVILDWVAVREYDANEPKVNLSLDRSAG